MALLAEAGDADMIRDLGYGESFRFQNIGLTGSLPGIDSRSSYAILQDQCSFELCWT